MRKALYLAVERNTEAGKQTGEVLPAAARRGKPGKVALVAVAARGSATGQSLVGHLKTLYIRRESRGEGWHPTPNPSPCARIRGNNDLHQPVPAQPAWIGTKACPDSNPG